MNEKETAQTTEEMTTAPAAETQEATQESLNVFQKFMQQLMGNGKESAAGKEQAAADVANPTETQAEATNGKSYTEADIKASVEAAQKKWQDEQKEQERLAKLPPAERVQAEQEAKDRELTQLRSQLLQNELKEAAVADLSKDGFPVGLAALMDYSSKENMEKSLATVKEVIQASVTEAVNQRLRGKTPAGLGGAASAENAIKDQIAKNIRGGM